MEMRTIGSLTVSAVGIGCNNFGRRIDAAASADVVYAALDAGVNFFDTADVYGPGQSEEYLGRALGSRRDEAIIATKFGNPMGDQGKGAHPDYVQTAVEASLRRLNTDYIDLYQLHVPDPDVPIAETLGALDALVQAGKVREIGCSNFSAEQIRTAEAAVQPGAARFVSVQNHYSLLRRDDETEVLPECERLGLAYLPYFPLESGLLTGKLRQNQAPPEGSRLATSATYNRVVTDRRMEQVEGLIDYSEAHEHLILDLAISWLLMRPVVASVIAGASNPQQVRANVAAANWKLTPAQLGEIDAIVA